MQLTSEIRRIVFVAAASAVSIVKQSSPPVGWSLAQYASNPSSSACCTNSTVRGQSGKDPPTMAKRILSRPAVTHGCAGCIVHEELSTPILPALQTEDIHPR